MSVWRAGLAMGCLATMLLGLAGSARAEVRAYRYRLLTRDGEATYAGQIKGSARTAGPLYEVETDEQRRIVRVTVIRSGKTVSETRYRFRADGNAPSAAERFVGDEVIGVARFHSDEHGQRRRDWFLAAHGVVTGYRTYAYAAGHVEATTYTADGKRRARTVSYYSAAGLLERSRAYAAADTTYYEYEWDTTTGLPRLRRKFVDGRLVAHSVYQHDAHGDPTREDLYDERDTRFGALEYTEGLLRRKVYRSAEGTVESRIAYDDRRLARAATLHVDGKLVCTFVYDQFPDGTIKRTLAIGPRGDVWAEYPDATVEEIDRFGHALDGRRGSIRKVGRWW